MWSGLNAYADLAAAQGVSPDRIVFEISERSDADRAVLAETVARIKSLGFRIAIDSFGVGNSNLLRPDIVKIDAGWFRRMMEDDDSRRLAHCIIHKLHEIGVHLLFEGVETPRELHWAREFAGSLIQGWLFGKAAAMVDATRDRRVNMPSTALLARHRA